VPARQLVCIHARACLSRAHQVCAAYESPLAHKPLPHELDPSMQSLCSPEVPPETAVEDGAKSHGLPGLACNMRRLLATYEA